MARGVGFYGKDFFSMKSGKDLLYESIIRILLTSPGERVMRPTFGAGMKSQLFNLVTPDYLQDLAITIHSSLIENERRIVVKEVQTEFDETEGIVKVKVITERQDDPDEDEVITFRYNVNV
jgi:phage baseplate assembly protein W